MAGKIRKSDLNSSIRHYSLILAGNPNVGKSTVFNALTGMNQHTGNWPGKTVVTACGYFRYNNAEFEITDLPGTYSLAANSPDEEVARDALCINNPDCVVVIVDATCLERNLNLVLQILEITNKVVICINLIDEAEKKHIKIDFDELSLQLGVPVVGTSARSKKGLKELVDTIYRVASNEKKTFSVMTKYNNLIEQSISTIQEEIQSDESEKLKSRWIAIQMLSGNIGYDSLEKFNIKKNNNLENAVKKAQENMRQNQTEIKDVRDMIIEEIVKKSEKIFRLCVTITSVTYSRRDQRADKILTSKSTGIPIMILMFAVIFYITIIGANYPSEWLSIIFSFIQEKLYGLFEFLKVPQFITGMIIDGMYRTLANVVAVMLPPMAIFFPLFTLLEDSGYLPRIAFNLDRIFCKAGAHGKQALTMMMGFGCNACGVTGCRIIESERERKIAAVTNNFSPCNGRFPTLIAIITMFFVGNLPFTVQSMSCAFILVVVIFSSIVVSLIVSKILSITILKGNSTSFILELPPYRKPQIIKTIIRSLCDRTIFVLGRAVVVAIPAGIIIWLLANIYLGNKSLIVYASEFIDPFAKIIGLDGVILLAFILGFPANEIVLPIAIMIYMSNGSITEYENLFELHKLLVDNGWTIVTAICTMVFSIMHFPCSTTCITIYKETKSIKWTALSIIIPTICGILCCMLINIVAHIFI